MKIRSMLRILPLTGLLVAIGGCAGVQQANRDAASIHKSASEAYADQPHSTAAVVAHPEAWLTGDPVPVQRDQPAILKRRVVLETQSAGSLQELATWIATQTRVPVRVDVIALSGGVGAAGVGAPLASGVPPLPGGQVQAFALSVAERQLGEISYVGPLSGLLDVVASRAGIWWRYRDGQVTFYNWESRTFSLPVLAATRYLTGSISTGGLGTGSGAGMGMGGGMGSGMMGGAMASPSMSSATTGGSGMAGGMVGMGVQANINYWSGIQKMVQGIAGTARVVVDGSLGMVTVTGTPPQVEAVAAWVREARAQLGRQVAVDVHIYNVKVSREDNYGLNFSLTNKGQNSYSVTGASVPTLLSSSTPMSLGASILSGPFGGTAPAVQALTTLGKVTQLYSDSGVTMNGQVLALSRGQTISYLAYSQTFATGIAAAGTSLQPGQVQVGFTGTFLPRVADGHVVLDLEMNIADLLGIRTVSSNGSSIEVPDTQEVTFSQSASLKPGQTLVLTGYRERSAQITNNGVGSPYNPALGGGVDSQSADTVMAVVITARTL